MTESDKSWGISVQIHNDGISIDDGEILITSMLLEAKGKIFSKICNYFESEDAVFDQELAKFKEIIKPKLKELIMSTIDF